MSTTNRKLSDMTQAEVEDVLTQGYGVARLELVFDAIKPVGNWKLPIETTVAGSVTLITRDEIRAAIDFYVGGGATFEDLEDGGYVVRAPGYYEQIGS